MRLAPILDRHHISPGTSLENNRRRHRLAAQTVRQRKGASLLNFGVPLQQRINLLGRDLDAALVDLEFAPADQRQVAVRINRANVAGQEPVAASVKSGRSK